MSAAAICTSYIAELFQGVHQPGDDYRIALYTDAAALDHTTLGYGSAGEVVGAGYVAGGKSLSGFIVGSSGKTAFVNFDTVSWANSTITARFALVYNATRSNKAVAVFDFGANKTSTNGPFNLLAPPATAAEALIRLSGP